MIEPAVTRVLICDDEPEILRILSWALRDHQVDAVSSGREALARIAQNTYHAFLCDLMMPDVTGMTLHAKLQEQHPDLLPRTLFITGGAYTSDARDFVERKDVVCIRKPFSVAQIREHVQRLRG